MNMKCLNLTFDEEGTEGNSKVLCTSRWTMQGMKNSCLNEGLGLTCSAEGTWETMEESTEGKKGKRQEREDEPKNGSDGEHEGSLKNNTRARALSQLQRQAWYEQEQGVTMQYFWLQTKDTKLEGTTQEKHSIAG